MDNLKEIRWKMASDLNIPYGEENSFFKGIDAAMELQLDVITKFMVWLPHFYSASPFYEWVNIKTSSEEYGVEIYKYFLKNIYQPE